MHSYFASQRPYGRVELVADAIVHMTGIAAASVASIFLLTRPMAPDVGGAGLAALAVYLFSLFAMLLASASYSLAKSTPFKWFLRRLDHAAIFLLIAGTYTPLLLQLPDRSLAMKLGAIVWIGAALGMAAKFFLPGRYDRAAIAAYLLLGWVAIFAFDSFVAALPPPAFRLVLLGGILYTAGILFHLWHSLSFHNAIWHAFVVAAAVCHFAAIAIVYAG